LIFIPIVTGGGAPYVNEWQHKVFVDVGAAEESARIAEAWNYLDPYPAIMELNPEFEFRTPLGWLVDYVNFYTIEDMAYHWWAGVGEIEKCFEKFCVTQWDDGFRLQSDFDIDVIIVKVIEDYDYCPTCIPGKPPE
jgi:hypothetical protein